MKVLDFEKEIFEMEKSLQELREIAKKDPVMLNELKELEKQLKHAKQKIYKNLSAWQIVQIARHPDRPHALDYIESLFEDFIELHGDRVYGDDPAIVAGIGKFEGLSVAVVAEEKGRAVQERIKRNFGMPHPEGYRKAQRIMKLADKFGLPVITFVDTPGAYPGLGAEERGQSEAIARNLLELSRLDTITVSVVIGEGGSGGALAIGMGDRVFILEYAYYSVISPEGCAAILWNSASATRIY
jgi:acetyl-CoA carboxylase carboxyl transferase subunit alpha